MDGNFYQLEWYCPDCKELHFGNCLNMAAVTTVSSNSGNVIWVTPSNEQIG